MVVWDVASLFNGGSASAEELSQKQLQDCWEKLTDPEPWLAYPSLARLAAASVPAKPCLSWPISYARRLDRQILPPGSSNSARTNSRCANR